MEGIWMIILQVIVHIALPDSCAMAEWTYFLVCGHLQEGVVTKDIRWFEGCFSFIKNHRKVS